MSIRDKLKSRKKREKIELCDTDLYVRTMSGLDRADFMDLSESFDNDGKGKTLARKNAALVSISLVDEDGGQIYTIDELDTLLEEMDASDIDLIVKTSLRVNKLTNEEQEGQEKN